MNELSRENFVNDKRLKTYPLVIFFAGWIITLLNFIFHRGWYGFGQILATDFVTLYSAGQIFQTNIKELYNLEYQFAIQQALIQPTVQPGVNPFISPPYVAQAYSLLTRFTLPTALVIWYVLTFAFVIAAAQIINSLAPTRLRGSHLSNGRLLIIIMSCFPFISGFQVGQNHGASLLLVSGILLFTLKEKQLLAGIFAGLLIFKPQFCLGYLIVWVVWWHYKAILTFGITAAIWAGITLFRYGYTPFLDYLNFSKHLLSIPYIDGFPIYLSLTPYSLLASIFPSSAAPVIQKLIFPIFAIMVVFLVWAAFRFRGKPVDESARGEVLFLAVIFPLVSTPYALFHDLVILIPGMVLWANRWPSRVLLRISAALYLGTFILPMISYGVKIALLALIPIGLSTILIYRALATKGPGEEKKHHALVG